MRILNIWQKLNNLPNLGNFGLQSISHKFLVANGGTKQGNT